VKISKGIVAAVREIGGRFLELDERTGTYTDIGDKKATEKTSQALREGQRKIRKQIYEEELMTASSPNPGSSGGSGGAKQTLMYDTSLLTSNSTPGKGISSEGYFGYSVQVLESLYNMEDESNNSTSPPPPLPPPTTTTARLPPFQSQKMASVKPSVVLSSTSTAMEGAPEEMVSKGQSPSLPVSNSAMAMAMAMALDQFPLQAPKPIEPSRMPLPPPRSLGMNQQQPPQPSFCSHEQLLRTSLGTFAASEYGRHSSRRTSITELLAAARNGSASFSLGDIDVKNSNDRLTIESILSEEIRELVRMSEPQLKQVEHTDINNVPLDMVLSSQGDGIGGKEIVLWGVNGGAATKVEEDRVSELRCSEVSRDHIAIGGGLTSASLLTTENNSSAMRFVSDDISVTLGSEKKPTIRNNNGVAGVRRHTVDGINEKKDDGNIADAELLLRLSNGNQDMMKD